MPTGYRQAGQGYRSAIPYQGTPTDVWARAIASDAQPSTATASDAAVARAIATDAAVASATPEDA